ncbi:hypothetical protein BS47DRAFT_1343657 [Hydnum rufescens UP504]|uniref:Uncharacterized protein n=1 Tax=Hydnum rufescens UP504 TaxID=1448309 RepID=A0A9P6AY35_9AGAM|nr:hypothetical protein BS47DRAFT_1343657 [Hydnum rufescens UP504]
MASRPLKNESWFHHVDSSRLGRLERARARDPVQCSYEVSLGAAPGTIRTKLPWATDLTSESTSSNFMIPTQL